MPRSSDAIGEFYTCDFVASYLHFSLNILKNTITQYSKIKGHLLLDRMIDSSLPEVLALDIRVWSKTYSEGKA